MAVSNNPNVNAYGQTYGGGGGTPASIAPVATGFTRDERMSDPFVREAYFGSPDTPGIISQAITAANRSFGQPAIMRQTAGLSPLELAAMQGAYGGIGSYQPFLDANLAGLQEGIGLSLIHI